ncbi:MAG: DUF192 domain-containing protein [Proteiniphilum sp.]|jgi:uncharacterized membrane protein (UPF0127 family)|nr:DUF192 domain-containing protein [Proteiniphilum sp.]
MSERKKSYRGIFLIGLLIIATAVGAYFLSGSGAKSGMSAEYESVDIPFRRQGELFFTGGQSGDTLAVIDIEVADDDRLRALGLMYRRSLPENAGMLFIQSMEEIQSFWMKNTYIPLDMIFVNADRVIVTIHANTAPLKEWSYASAEPALYVVEVNAGFASRHGIRTGDGIAFSLSRRDQAAP